MRFLNCLSLLCAKTLSYSVRVQCMYLHNTMLKHSINSLNLLKLQHLCREHYGRIHFSIGLCAKSFRETENEYAHEVLQTIPAYAKSTVKQPVAFGVSDYSEGNKELSEFAKVTMHCMSLNINLEEGPFSLPVLNLIKRLPSLSDENLLKCLFLLCCLPPTPKTWTPNFKALWNSLDSECVKRLPTWSTSQKLLVADYWFHLRLNRISQYNRNMIDNLLQRLSGLTDAEMVQLMFYINLQRELRLDSSESLKVRLVPVVKNISIDELGIVCLGFFKTKNKLNDISVIKIIIERFIDEIEVAKNLTLVSLLKFLKKSIQLSYTEMYIPLLHKCTAYTCRWDVHTCIHLALLASECHVYHPLLLDSIVERLCSTIERARLKDMMKLLQCLSHFNHHPPQKFNSLLFSEIRKESRRDEIAHQPRILIYIALYYSYVGHYNHTLLNVVLDSDFAQKCILAFPETELTFAEVDCCTEIECKDYTGNRLGRHFWTVLEKRRGSVDVKKQNAFTRLLGETLSAFTSKENIEVKHTLPHMFSPDIVIRVSGDQKSCDKDILFSPPKEEKWACLVMGVPYSFAYRSRHRTGVTAMKMRQLEKLGYKAILIPHYELPRDIERRKKYLERKLRCIGVCCNLF
nr:FAST kinase domain-containing protein 5, mitochondrial [Parasteatoda tepidariorum]